MGIGNTTAAAAVAAALFGGGGARWAGRGTGVDHDGLARKRAVIDRALARHAAILNDPIKIAAALGGRELAAILGAALAARLNGIPVVLDGFVSTAAVAPLAKLRADTLAHAVAGHVSAEAAPPRPPRRTRPHPAARSPHAAWAKPRARRRRCCCCAPRSRVIRAWRRSRRRGCRTSRRMRRRSRRRRGNCS